MVVPLCTFDDVCVGALQNVNIHVHCGEKIGVLNCAGSQSSNTFDLMETLLNRRKHTRGRIDRVKDAVVKCTVEIQDDVDLLVIPYRPQTRTLERFMNKTPSAVILVSDDIRFLRRTCDVIWYVGAKFVIVQNSKKCRTPTTTYAINLSAKRCTSAVSL